jgi:hypothetical protein
MDDVQEATAVEEILRALPHNPSEEMVVQATHGFRRSAVNAALHRIQNEASRPVGWDFNAKGDIEIRDDNGVVRVRIRRDGGIDLCDATSGAVTYRIEDPPKLEMRGSSGRTVKLRISPEGVYLGTGLPTTDPAMKGFLWNDEGTVKVSSG